MHTISLFPVNSVAHMVQPDEFNDLDMNSPATEFFTDFKKHRPLTIENSTLAIDVESLMRKAHVRMKLVVDRRNDHIRGLISASDVARRLHMPIRIEKVPTFVDIFRSIRR